VHWTFSLQHGSRRRLKVSCQEPIKVHFITVNERLKLLPVCPPFAPTDLLAGVVNSKNGDRLSGFLFGVRVFNAGQ